VTTPWFLSRFPYASSSRLRKAARRLFSLTVLISPFVLSQSPGLQQMPVVTADFFPSMLIRQRTAVVPSDLTLLRLM